MSSTPSSSSSSPSSFPFLSFVGDNRFVLVLWFNLIFDEDIKMVPWCRLGVAAILTTLCPLWIRNVSTSAEEGIGIVINIESLEPFLLTTVLSSLHNIIGIVWITRLQNDDDDIDSFSSSSLSSSFPFSNNDSFFLNFLKYNFPKSGATEQASIPDTFFE